MKPERNDLCRCGSGKKYKHCCEGKVAPVIPMPTHAEIDQLAALYNASRYEELESRARLLVGQYPDFGFGWKLLGGALQMQGKNALPAFQKTAEIMSGEADAHYNLGVALKSSGLLVDAAASYRRALKIKPDYVEAYSNLGNVLKELGQLDDAVVCYRQALALNLNSAETHNNLGTALKDLGQFNAALASYRRAVELKQDYAEVHYNLGNILKELGQLNEAAASYRRAIEFKPDFAKAHSNLGVVLRGLVQLDAAAECYRRALEIDPECFEALLGVGQMFMESGEKAEAEEQFQKLLKIRPDNIEVLFLIAQLNKVKVGDENLASLEALEVAAQNGVSPLPENKMISLHFALGKCFDDIGDYDKAFQHFIEGCRLKRSTFEYDAGKMTQHFDDIVRVFDRGTIDRLRGGGDPSRLPIFVLGMPRSGTTLTEQIIASHPDVHGAGELPDLQMIVQRDAAGSSAPYPNNIPVLDQANLAAWAADYVAGLYRRAPEARHISDKMPGNFFFTGLIHVMLPNAKIIHVNRNPVDTCLSCFTQLFERKQNYTYDLAELGRYYVDYARLMAHWRSVLPAGAFLDVLYEDIVADQETQARRMIAFCGLDWNDACIEFHKNKRPINTASVTQVRQPIYKSSVERWRPYEKFLGPLLDTLGDLAPQRD